MDEIKITESGKYLLNLTNQLSVNSIVYVNDVITDDVMLSEGKDNTRVIELDLIENDILKYEGENVVYHLEKINSENLRVNKIKKETANNMQTHENTNVQKPVIIGKKPYYKSPKFKLNLLDYLKGFLIASLTSVLFVVQQIADGGTLDALNYKPVLMAAISGGCGYLLKNFLTDSSKK